MCQSKTEGGKRCEYADTLANVRRKVRNTNAYQRADSFTQKKMIQKKLDAWKKQHPEIVTEHLPSTMNMNTRASTWSEERTNRLKRVFPDRMAAWNQETTEIKTQALYDERQELENNGLYSNQELNTINFYTISGFSDTNHFLRFGKSKYLEDNTEENLTSIQTHIERLKRMTQRESKIPHTVYRHMLVPTGVKEKDYIEKYFTVGSRVRDEGFLSTTEDPSYIAGHMHKRRPSKYVVFEIVTPQGISLQKSPEEQTGLIQSFEKERLLPAGTNFRVIGTKTQRLGVPEDRESLRTQFGGYNRTIPTRTVHVVQLVDEEYAKKLED